MEYRVNTDSSKVSEKISEAYSNLESMRIAIDNLKKTTGTVSVRSPLRYIPNTNNLSKTPVKELSENPSYQNLNFPNSKLLHSNSNKYLGNNIDNINTNFNSQINNNFSKTGNFSSNNIIALNSSNNNHNLVNQYSSNFLGGTALLNERLNSLSKQKDLNLSTSSINNFKTLDNLEREFEFLKEEYEGTVVTNKILNKSNLELKNQIKMLENELNQKDQETRRAIELNRTIEDLRATICHGQKLQQDSNDIIQSLKQLNNELNQEINQMKASQEEIKNGISIVENENEDLKKIIKNNELNTKNSTEKILELREKIMEKDRYISEQNEKIVSLSNLNDNLKKSLRDYEDMLSGLKKTVEIMKKANNSNEIDIQNLNKTLFEQKEIIDNKNNELCELDNKALEQGNEIEVLKQEVLNMKETLNVRDGTLSENVNVIRNLSSELEKKNIKIEGLIKILEDKENTIANLKNSVNLLNKNLEDTNETVATFKKMNNEGMSSKSLLLKSSEKFEVENIEIKRKIEDLTSLKENLIYKVSILENELSESKQRENKYFEEKETLSLDNKNLVERISYQTEENKKLYEEKNTKEKAISHLERRFNEINNLYNQMYTNDIYLKNEVESLNSKITLKDKMIENLLITKDEINDELVNLREKLTHLTLDKTFRNDDSDEKISELKMNEIKLKRDLEKMENELKSKEVLTESLNNLITEFKNKLNSTSKKKEGEIIILERTIEELRKENSILKEAESKLLVELEDSRNDLKYKTKLVDSLNSNVSELNESMITTKKEKDKYSFFVKEKNEIIEELKQQIMELKMKSIDEEKKINDNLKNKDDFKIHYQEIVNKCNNYQKDYYEMKSSYEKLAFQYKTLLEKHESKLEKSVKLESPSMSNNSLLLNNEINPSNVKLINEFEIKNEFQRSDENPQLNLNNLSPMNNELKEKVFMNTFDLNLNLSQKYRSNRISIFDGPSLLFSIFDNKRIIKFDIEERKFKYVEFADFGDYEENFILEGSFYLNLKDNLFIVTGKHHNILYHYNHVKHSMSRLSSTNHNHKGGALIKHKDYLLCLSGINTKKVEKYHNSELFKGEFIDKKLNNTWKEYTQLNFERTRCSYLIINDKHLYSIFGYNEVSKKSLDSIERLDIEMGLQWEFINVKSEKNIPIYFYDHCCFTVKNENIILFGGINGTTEKENKNFYNLDLSSNSLRERELKIENEEISMIFSRNINTLQYQESLNKRYHNIIFTDDFHIINFELEGLSLTTYKFD